MTLVTDHFAGVIRTFVGSGGGVGAVQRFGKAFRGEHDDRLPAQFLTAVGQAMPRQHVAPNDIGLISIQTASP